MLPDTFWSKIKKVQRIHQWLYTSGMGWVVGWIILLLEHTGRRTGKSYATPLQYEKINGSYYVGAARGKKADWYRNLLVNPRVHVRVGSESFDALAEPVTDPVRVADFLAYRLKRHPLMLGLMMKLHQLPMKPTREQLITLGGETTLIILHPKEVHK